VVPQELIIGPLAVEQLPVVDILASALRKEGAEGQGVVLNDALGLHFNIDLQTLDVTSLTAYLKAYMLNDRELRQEVARGWRQSAALPPDYPSEYRRLVMADTYWPNLDVFTADYLAANPTRKRALDLLPALSVLSPVRVSSRLPREKIGPRPVLHYRLPQVYLSDPNWSVIPDWERWLRVEAEALRQLEIGRSSGANGQ
jgi:hypothetical protein